MRGDQVPSVPQQHPGQPKGPVVAVHHRSTHCQEATHLIVELLIDVALIRLVAKGGTGNRSANEGSMDAGVTESTDLAVFDVGEGQRFSANGARG